MYQKPENIAETLSNPNDKKLQKMREKSLEAGGEKRVINQHKKGKLTARERIELLVDEGSFFELDQFVTHQNNKFEMEKNKPLGDGVITGYASIGGRIVYLYSQDFTVFGGSLGKAHADKI